MKKNITVLLGIISLFVSCKASPPLKSITITEPKTEFFIGEKFEAGKKFLLQAHYDDGSTQDFKAKKCEFFYGDINLKNYTFTEEQKLTVTVVFQNKSTQYSIIVKKKETSYKIFGMLGYAAAIIIGIGVLLFGFKLKGYTVHSQKNAANVCNKIEKILHAAKNTPDNDMCAINCRKGVESMVRFIYQRERLGRINITLTPGKIINIPEFQDCVGYTNFLKFQSINKAGNQAAHNTPNFDTAMRTKLLTDTEDLFLWFKEQYL